MAKLIAPAIRELVQFHELQEYAWANRKFEDVDFGKTRSAILISRLDVELIEMEKVILYPHILTMGEIREDQSIETFRKATLQGESLTCVCWDDPKQALHCLARPCPNRHPERSKT